MIAVLLEPASAIRADSTGIDHASDSRQIAFLELFDVFADFGDAAYNFVPWNHRIDGVVPLIPNLMEIGVANAAVEDIDGYVGHRRVSPFQRVGRKRRGCGLCCKGFRGYRHEYSPERPSGLNSYETPLRWFSQCTNLPVSCLILQS
jgi:hypothetical protein